MRRIVASLWMSLDGVVESPETWGFRYSDDDLQAANEAGMAAADAMLLGRVTYQLFASFWPQQGSDVPIADYINTTPKFVVSSTLPTVEWQNSTLLGTDLGAELDRLRRQPGRNMTVVGSPTLVRSLLRDGRLDQLRLTVAPILLGRGQRLFEDASDQVPLTLVDSQTFRTGVLSLAYEPSARSGVGDGAAGSTRPAQ